MSGDDPKPDDPFGDKAFLEEKRRDGAATPGRAAKGLTAPPAEKIAGDPEEDIASHEAAVRGHETAALRDKIMDLDRVDVERLAHAEGEAARAEMGFKWKPDDLGLPPHCPVTPLGKKKGTFYFLTPDKELLDLAAGNFGQAHIDALFAPQSDYLIAMWGQASRANKIRVQYEALRRSLMDACARRGVFDPGDKVRGRGAWKSASGGLILHYGDQVVIDGAVEAPGMHGGLVYPAGPKLTPPKGDGEADARKAAKDLFTMLRCWNWGRGELDARLLLGWLMASMLGAAIDWRPQIMLTGDAGTGKSTLQHLMKSVLGDRLLDVADASAAGLYQTLGYDALGVAFDEFENEDEAKGAAVMRLARLASSGARLVRGGADGVPSNYQARGAFLFSAINPPAMRPAEQTRTTILALRPLNAAARAPLISSQDAAEIGARLAARAIHMWSFWPERLDRFRGALANMKHSARGQDQLGTLLAAADLALSDGDPSGDELAELTELAPAQLFESAGGAPNWRRCLNHVLGSQPEQWRGLRYKQVGQALEAFINDHENSWTKTELRQQLALAGLALVFTEDGDFDLKGHRTPWIGFPPRHPALARLFDGTDWSARRGADGAWINAIAQAPDGTWKRDRFRIGGAREHGVIVRLGLMLDRDEEKENDDA